MGGEASAYDDGDVEDHVGDVAELVDPKGDDELAEGGAEGIGEAGEGGGSHAAAVGEPEIGVAGRGGEHEGLGEAGEDLAEHDEAEHAAGAGVRAGEADPVADEEEGGGRHDGRLRAEVQHIDDDGGDEGEGEEKGGAQPVDDGLGRVEVAGRMAGDGREGEPLVSMVVSTEQQNNTYTLMRTSRGMWLQVALRSAWKLKRARPPTQHCGPRKAWATNSLPCVIKEQ